MAAAAGRRTATTGHPTTAADGRPGPQTGPGRPGDALRPATDTRNRGENVPDRVTDRSLGGGAPDRMTEIKVSEGVLGLATEIKSIGDQNLMTDALQGGVPGLVTNVRVPGDVPGPTIGKRTPEEGVPDLETETRLGEGTDPGQEIERKSQEEDVPGPVTDRRIPEDALGPVIVVGTWKEDILGHEAVRVTEVNDTVQALTQVAPVTWRVAAKTPK